MPVAFLLAALTLVAIVTGRCSEGTGSRPTMEEFAQEAECEAGAGPIYGTSPPISDLTALIAAASSCGLCRILCPSST